MKPLDPEKYHFFYGGICSQWYHCNFTINKFTYNCAEQWMMAEKARLFGDENIEKYILTTSSPHAQKSAGKLVKPFDKDVWEKIEENGKPYCWNIVYQGNHAKFVQNKFLLDELLATGDKTLVEASPSDVLWGIGLAEDDPKCYDQDEWRGTNWLGEVLTTLRNNLKNEKDEEK